MGHAVLSDSCPIHNNRASLLTIQIKAAVQLVVDSALLTILNDNEMGWLTKPTEALAQLLKVLCLRHLLDAL